MGADDTGIYFHKNYKIPDSIPIGGALSGISIPHSAGISTDR